MSGPTQSYSQQVMLSNHRLPGEDFREGVNRIAGALTNTPQEFHALQEITMERRFLFAGRIQASAGSPKSTTMHNCFVSGTIEDSYVDGEGCIMDRLKEAAATMRMGGGIGYDFSTLRPSGSMIRKLNSTTFGPMKFMDLYNANGLCVASSGHRRGAQMGVMRIDHPDIMDFIHAKQERGRLEGFNVSVAVTDKFMKCLEQDEPFEQTWNGESYGMVDPNSIWDAMMRSTWDYAEPGVIFIDRINNDNNLWYCEEIAATNPCGEQPLPPFGACLLGSLLLTMYLGSGEDGLYLDVDQIVLDIPHIVRALDNVNDLSHYALPQQRAEALSKRRMGIGVTGLANAIEACGHPYGSPGFLHMQEGILSRIRDAAYQASIELAVEKEPFPLFDAQRYGRQGFVSRMDEGIREDIRKHGIRNSHLLSIAPTGSISFGLGDNCSSSIEPVFSYSQDRTVIEEGSSKRVDPVSDWAYRELGVEGRRTRDVTVDEHLSVLSLAQKCVDSAVAKTINVGADTSWEEFKSVYVRAYRMGAKGCTTYRAAGKREGVIKDTDEGATCEIMPDGSRSCE